MISPLIKLITASISTLLVMVFVFGLADSISSGFADLGVACPSG